MTDKPKEIDTFAAEEDAEVFQDPESKLVICSPPRAASTFLCGALTVAGIGKPAEYFGTEPERRIRLRTCLPKSMDLYSTDATYFDDVICRRCFDGLFATKLQYWQLKRLMRARLTQRLFDGARVVYLTRDDLRDQIVSQAVANLTQRWGEINSSNDDSERFSDKQLREAALYALEFLLEERKGFEEFFALQNINPLRIRSEDVAAEPVRCITRLISNIGREVADIRALERFCSSKQRYKTDSTVKDRLREVVLPGLKAETEFIRRREVLATRPMAFKSDQEP